MRTLGIRAGSGRPPPVIINSIDGGQLLELISSNRRDAMTAYLLGEVNRLAAAGAVVGLLASNTVHIVFDELQESSPIPLISIVEAARDAADGLTRLGLFATRFTVQADIYRSVFAARGIEVIAPSGADQELIHGMYFDELVVGKFLPETRTQLLEVAGRMRSEHSLDAIILGGTELPLLLGDELWDGLRFLDTTRIHAEAAVARMLR